MSRADIFKRKEREVTADSIVKDSVNAADALNNIYGKGRSNKTVSENRAQKEFEKTDEALRDVETAKQQKGGEEPEGQVREIPRYENREVRHRTSNDRAAEREAERRRDIERRRAEAARRALERDRIRKEEHLREERLADRREDAMVHDMTEQVLGQTYKVPGTNISYDDAAIMARNNIRDSAELTGISLEDDGFANSVEEVQAMMKGYVFNGVPDIEEVYTIANERNYGADVVAQAYVNVLKEVDINQNIQALTRIDEKFCFDHQAFETQFDYIREHDGAADHVLDKIEMELGRERE